MEAFRIAGSSCPIRHLRIRDWKSNDFSLAVRFQPPIGGTWIDKASVWCHRDLPRRGTSLHITVNRNNLVAAPEEEAAKQRAILGITGDPSRKSALGIRCVSLVADMHHGQSIRTTPDPQPVSDKPRLVNMHRSQSTYCAI